jgi:hypothetical protein
MERTIAVRTELESILVEEALAMARELEAGIDGAPDGQVLDIGEQAVIRLGRELARSAPEAALRRQAEAAGKKEAPAAPALAAAAAPSRTRRPGRSWPPPGAWRRPAARSAAPPAARPPTRWRTDSASSAPSARGRSGWLAGRRRAGRSMWPRPGWRSSPASGSTTRRFAATSIGPPRPRAATRPRGAFAAAEGEAGLLADGVMAPSRDGWCQLKLAAYPKRPAGEPAEPEERR